MSRPAATALTLLNWNTAWKRPAGRAGRIIQQILSESAADVLCLAEGFTDGAPPGYGGLFSEADHGYPIIPGRRKVALWSRDGWRDGSDHLDGAPPGRFASGVTETAGLGAVRVIGVCVPWEAAHVSTGRRDRRRWEDHVLYLRALDRHLDGIADGLPTILTGDFNQTWPPSRAPEAARRLLAGLAARLTLVPRAEPALRSVCHMFASASLAGRPIADLPDRADGIRLSDHRGHLAGFDPA